MTCFSCFFTLAISFLSPERAAFMDSLLHWLTSLFQSLNCSLFVSSRLVVEVASETPKAMSMTKNVEFGMKLKKSTAKGYPPKKRLSAGYISDTLSCTRI